eukprot:3625425-Lingulodinium_polyedra.AAC.1
MPQADADVASGRQRRQRPAISPLARLMRQRPHSCAPRQSGARYNSGRLAPTARTMLKTHINPAP